MKKVNEKSGKITHYDNNTNSKFINLFELYGKFNKDINLETNTLSNLDNENIVETLNFNWSNRVESSRLKSNKNKVPITYHKINFFSSKRERTPKEREGYYEVIITPKRKKFFTSFKATLDFLLKEKLNPTWRCTSNG